MKTGDIVQLKSGGPHMTIREQTACYAGTVSGSWRCEWFDLSNSKKPIVQEHDFLETSLNLIKQS